LFFLAFAMADAIIMAMMAATVPSSWHYPGGFSFLQRFLPSRSLVLNRPFVAPDLPPFFEISQSVFGFDSRSEVL